MHRRCDCNRKRSKRRAIYCPIHRCYLDSVSQKYQPYADRAGQLQQRGIPRRNALMLVATQTTVPLEGEWIEAFWCEQCQQTKWYHVCKGENNTYEVRQVPPDLWQYAMGAIDSEGNPSVGEFTRRHARLVGFNGIKGFQFIG
ncbi:hypothetical protein [Fischerella sp. PCC 9605]|uniref:hypothetical protein n=1 Tax=Fischerella sp. PCC 9605 TaxID=1173024 RepID=UPI00047C5FBF|nr:hypothetical protein [Fischerella sp. PCC 9605]